MMRQSGAKDSSQHVHIYSADMRRSISLQFYPDGYDLVEPQPVLVSEGYSSHRAGTRASRGCLKSSTRPGLAASLRKSS